jgi:AcrR family transcriptional regulator
MLIRVVRQALTREQIIRAAIEVLDAEGLEGLNMRRLGTHLGCAPTAVYWHVHSKDELVVLASDKIWTEIERPDPDLVGWREAAMIMARSFHAMVTRHLWFVQAMGAYFTYGPGKASHDEHCMLIYEQAGFTGPEADWAMNTVGLFVAGQALTAAAAAARMRRMGPDPQAQAEQMRKVMEQIVESVKPYPRLYARAQDYLDADPAEPERSFDFGLDTIFDGLERRLASQRQPARADANPLRRGPVSQNVPGPCGRQV